MFDGQIYSWRMRKLQKTLRNARAKNKNLAETAKAENKSEADIENLRFDGYETECEIFDEITQIRSNYLVAQANAFVIPIPEFDKFEQDWVQSRFTEKWRLGSEAQKALWDKIRDEQRGIRELWQSWMSLLIGLGGIVVAILALVLKK